MTTFRFQMNKLIRDEMKKIMQSKGIIVHGHTLSDSAYISALKDKLIEESREVLHAKDATELQEELADVAEVFTTLIQVNGFTWDQIEYVRLAKQKAKGGFDQKWYTTFVEIEDANPIIEYYRSRPLQYPEIK